MRSRITASICLAMSLSACATLPSSGPTGSQIQDDIQDPESLVPMKIVEVVDAASIPAARAPHTLPLAELAPPPTDMVGPGDVLNIAIYEAGVTLFGGVSAPAMAEGPTINPSVSVQTLPPSRVDDNGNITVPYAGSLHVVGKTVSEIEQLIRTSLKGLSQNPQVLVTLSKVITNSVILSGEVAQPGRLVLQTNRETLSDVIALAGGYRGSAKDLTLRVFRRDEHFDIRLSDLVDNPVTDIRAYPGDRYMLINDPRSYSVLGASGRVNQLPFSSSEISLVEAIATAGGSHPNLGDAGAIFVFRYVPDEQGELSPVVYHINMMNAGSFFLAQRFQVRDKDVLYFGNSAANQPTKMIQLISQLFSPIVTATSMVNMINDSNN